MQEGIFIKGAENLPGGTYKFLFSDALQAEQCVNKLNGMIFGGVRLEAFQEIQAHPILENAKSQKGDPNSNIRFTNLDLQITQQ